MWKVTPIYLDNPELLHESCGKIDEKGKEEITLRGVYGEFWIQVLYIHPLLTDDPAFEWDRAFCDISEMFQACEYEYYQLLDCEKITVPFP